MYLFTSVNDFTRKFIRKNYGERAKLSNIWLVGGMQVRKIV